MSFKNNSLRSRAADDDLNHVVMTDYLTIHIGDQLFGISVLQVQDVLGPQRLTRIPLASPEIAGILNLRGRIVTAIDTRKRLNLSPFPDYDKTMSVVIEYHGELFSLIIDKVGDVIKLNEQDFEDTPATLDPLWHSVSDGVYRMEGKLLVILDVASILDDSPKNASSDTKVA